MAHLTPKDGLNEHYLTPKVLERKMHRGCFVKSSDPLAMTARGGFLKASGLVNVLLGGCLVLVDKVRFAVAAQPRGELSDFFSKPGYGLLIHVRLGEKFGQGN
jgi:hypothetical protein